MEQLRETLDPFITLIPEGVRDFWLLIICAIALAVLLPVVYSQRRLIRVLVTGRHPRQPLLAEPQTEDLASYGELTADQAQFAPTGQRRLVIEGVPARLALVVVAPLGTGATVTEASVDEILNQALWGLASVSAHDHPRIRVWPPQLSAHGFAAVFHRNIHRPEPDTDPSHWILLAGMTPPRPRPVCLGLALWTDEKTTIGRLSMEPSQWVTLLRVEAAPPPGAATDAASPPDRSDQQAYSNVPEPVSNPLDTQGQRILPGSSGSPLNSFDQRRP